MTGGSALSINIDGYIVQGLLHASFNTTNCYSADTFSITFAIGSAPLSDLAFWSSLTSSYVEVSTVLASGSALETVISGMIDNIVIDPIGGSVAIEGRDLSASLIDCCRQQDFVNQTASEIVAAIGQYHGLTTVASTTSTNVGRYYVDGYTRLSLGQFSRLRSDWDLVVQLARENRFDAFVVGRTLYFQDPTGTNELVLPIDKGDVKKLTVERSLNIGAAPSAQVQSWNSQNMAPYSSDGHGASASIAGNNNYLFSSSNFTPQQVLETAARYTSEITRLSTVLNLEMPWDFSYSSRSRILLTGTASILDTTYMIDSVERHHDTRFGSNQIIRAIGID